MTENTETTTLTAEQILKSKQAFNDYVELHHEKVSAEAAKGYPPAYIHLNLSQLTQAGSVEIFSGFAHTGQYIFWYVVNEKEEILKSLAFLNSQFKKGTGIFVLKAVLNGDKIEFNTILAPEIKQAAKREVNRETPTKQLQKEFWQLYSEICDEGGLGDLQIEPAAQHYQYIPTGKGGSQLLVTLNVQNSLATVEFMNNNDLDKVAFNKLLESKTKIENNLKGIELEWCELQGKKSSKIKTMIEIKDINDREEWKTVIKTQLAVAEKFRAIIPKYL